VSQQDHLWTSALQVSIPASGLIQHDMFGARAYMFCNLIWYVGRVCLSICPFSFDSLRVLFCAMKFLTKCIMNSTKAFKISRSIQVTDDKYWTFYANRTLLLVLTAACCNNGQHVCLVFVICPLLRSMWNVLTNLHLELLRISSLLVKFHLHSPRMLLWTRNILGQLGVAMPQVVQVTTEEREAPAGNISLLFNLFGVLRK
jgi:hypothetical protein